MDKKANLHQKPSTSRDVVTIIYVCIVACCTVISIVVFYYCY